MEVGGTITFTIRMQVFFQIECSNVLKRKIFYSTSIQYNWFHGNGSLSVHSLHENYLSIPQIAEGTVFMKHMIGYRLKQTLILNVCILPSFHHFFFFQNQPFQSIDTEVKKKSFLNGRVIKRGGGGRAIKEKITFSLFSCYLKIKDILLYFTYKRYFFT